MNILDAQFLISLTNPSTVLSASGSIEELLGFKPDDFVSGKVKLQDRIHAEDQDIAERLFAGADASSTGSFPIRLRQANDSIRIVRLHYTKILPPSSASTQIQLLLQDAKSLFLNSQQAPMTVNFRSLMENTNDFIFFKDENHVLTSASQTLATICPPAKHWSDLIGRTDYEIFPERYADIYYRLEKRVFSGIPVANEIQEYQAKDGSDRWVDNRKYPIHDDNGDIIGLFGIARDITDRKRLEDILKHQAYTDFLTGLNSRSHFLELSEHEISRTARYGKPLSLLMIDIDFFKKINDTHGHATGDAALVKFAKVCRRILRDIDIIGRIGGEEFAVLLPETDKDKAAEVAERLRMAHADAKVSLTTGSLPLHYTISIGIAAYSPKTRSIHTLLQIADEALYEAKNSGRNRVCVATQR